MSRVEEIAMRVFRIDKVIYFHDGGCIQRLLMVKHEKFNERDYAEQGLKTLASMDFHFPWNTNKFTRWLSTFFLIYPLHPNVLVR